MNKKLVLEITADISLLLTIVAAIPYELGPAAEVLPPKIKMWMVGIGAGATIGLRITKIIVKYVTGDYTSVEDKK